MPCSQAPAATITPMPRYAGQLRSEPNCMRLCANAMGRYQDTEMSPCTNVWHARRRPCASCSSVRCLRSLGLISSTFSRPLSIVHLQVPHSPPPHLNGMPPCARSEARSKLVFSAISAVLPWLVMKVMRIMSLGPVDIGRRRREVGGLQAGIQPAKRAQLVQLAARPVITVEGCQEFRRHPGDRAAALLCDAPHARLPVQAPDLEMRAHAPAQDVVPRLQQRDIGARLGALLAGLGSQDDVHVSPLLQAAASWRSSMSCSSQSWQTSR